MFGRSKKGDKKGKAKAKKPPKPPKGKKKKKAPGVPVKKRPTDVYTVMLMMSLAFVMLACVFLFLELQVYDFPNNPTPWK